MLQLTKVHIAFGKALSFSSDKYKEIKFLGHMVVLFSILRNFHAVFHSDCTSCHLHQQCMRVSFSPHPCQHLLFVFFSMTAILTGRRWYLTVILICVSLMINDAERLFICLLAICISALEKCLFRSSAHFLIRLFLWCSAVWALCIFWILTPYWIYHLQISSPIQ